MRATEKAKKSVKKIDIKYIVLFIMVVVNILLAVYIFLGCIQLDSYGRKTRLIMDKYDSIIFQKIECIENKIGNSECDKKVKEVTDRADELIKHF